MKHINELSKLLYFRNKISNFCVVFQKHNEINFGYNEWNKTYYNNNACADCSNKETT